MTSILFLTISIAHKYFLSDYFFCLLNSLRDMQTIAAASIPSVGPAPGHSHKVSCRNNNYTYVSSCSKRSLLQLLFTRVLKRWVFYLCILYPAPKRPFIHYRVGISTYFVPTLHRTSKTLSFIKTSEIQKLITFVKSIHHMWSQSYRYPFQPKKGPKCGHNLVTANIDITKSMLE